MGRAEHRAPFPTTGLGVGGGLDPRSGWQRGLQSGGRESGAPDTDHQGPSDTGKNDGAQEATRGAGGRTPSFLRSGTLDAHPCVGSL